jgi:hypothetical protein
MTKPINAADTHRHRKLARLARSHRPKDRPASGFYIKISRFAKMPTTRSEAKSFPMQGKRKQKISLTKLNLPPMIED